MRRVAGECGVLPPLIPRSRGGRRLASPTEIRFVAIGDPSGIQPARHGVLRHVGVATRAGEAAHVDQQCDVVPAERGREFLVTGVDAGVMGASTTLLLRAIDHLTYGYTGGPMLAGM